MTVSTVSLEIFEFLSQICLLSSPPCFICLLSKLLNLIGCWGHMKGKFLKNIKKNLLRNHKGDEAETVHTCLGHWPLHKLCVFYSGRIRTLVAMETYIFHRLISGKVKIDNFFCLSLDIWNLFIQKCLLSSRLCFICALSKSLNLIGCRGHMKGKFLKKC